MTVNTHLHIDICSWIIDRQALKYWACADTEGGRGSGSSPQINHKNIGFLSNTCPNTCTWKKKHKATKSLFNVGHRWHTSETPLKWRFAGGPTMPPSDNTFWIHAWYNGFVCDLLCLFTLWYGLPRFNTCLSLVLPVGRWCAPFFALS